MVIPVVVIAVAALIFLLMRRRKRITQTGNQETGIDSTATGGPQMRESGLMVVANEHYDHNVPEKPELHGSTTAIPLTSSPYTQAAYQYPPALNANELPVPTTTPIPAHYHTPYQHQPLHHPQANELPGPAVAAASVSPVSAAELSDHDRWSHAHELRNQNDWSQTHELGVPSRAASVYSDAHTLTGDPERDVYLEELKAKRAAVAEERERLRRMEMLREEDERLEREIEEYEKMRGV